MVYGAFAGGGLSLWARKLNLGTSPGYQAGENQLSTSARLKTQTNDGMADYPAGKQIFDYTVYLKP
jgi:hypothetical protein